MEFVTIVGVRLPVLTLPTTDLGNYLVTMRGHTKMGAPLKRSHSKCGGAATGRHGMGSRGRKGFLTRKNLPAQMAQGPPSSDPLAALRFGGFECGTSG